jgi:hypothetical protein
MNKYKLASLLMKYKADEPHAVQDSLHYPIILESQIMDWLKEEHGGDCTDECFTCQRCIVEEMVFKANWLIEELCQYGYKIKNV